MSSQEESGLKNVMNSSKKLPMTLESGWLRVYHDGHRLTSKAIVLLVSFSKQMSVSEIWFHQISSRAQGKMWMEGSGSAVSQTMSGIGWGMVQVQRTAREGKKTPWGIPLVRETCPSLVRSTAGQNPAVQGLPPCRALPLKQDTCPYKSLSEWSYFHHDFPALQAPLQTTHTWITLGEKNTGKQIF